MKLIAQVKPEITPEQHQGLKQILKVTNRVADYISQRARETNTFRQYDLHQLLYSAVREQVELSAHMTVCVIAQVADAYKLDREIGTNVPLRRTFAPI